MLVKIIKMLTLISQLNFKYDNQNPYNYIDIVLGELEIAALLVQTSLVT